MLPFCDHYQVSSSFTIKFAFSSAQKFVVIWCCDVFSLLSIYRVVYRECMLRAELHIVAYQVSEKCVFRLFRQICLYIYYMYQTYFFLGLTFVKRIFHIRYSFLFFSISCFDSSERSKPTSNGGARCTT